MAFLNGQEVKDVLRPGALRGCHQCHWAGEGTGDISQYRLGPFGERLAGRTRQILVKSGLFRWPQTAKPVIVMGDMAEDASAAMCRGFGSGRAGRIQLEVRLLPTNQGVNPAPVPQLTWAWGGQTCIRIGQLRQDGDMDGESCFVSCWWRHSP